jgi:hypothetical protein
MTLEQIKKKIRYGDYSTLGLMLAINPDAAKMRFLRNDSLAIQAMTIIITHREEMITKFHQTFSQDLKQHHSD